ncbi:MAG: YihY/virulence factor BrkB family protein, partial [Odoribacter sp.]|nr:YihY/virulence factor BrkB family protein [Odoribacter sp.]
MKRIGNLKKFLYPEFYYSVLRRDWRISTFVTDFFLKVVAVLVVSADRFVKDASAISASALTFYSTLSFIPVVALILAIARGFGAASALEDWLKEQTYTNPEVMQWVMNVAGKALDHTQGGVVAGFGILLLIWSVVRMLSSTELAMNRIWGVKKGRGIVKKFTDYLSILFIAPILIVLISSMNVFMMSNLQSYALDEGFLSYASVALKALLTVIPYVLVWFLFVFLYMFMP